VVNAVLSVEMQHLIVRIRLPEGHWAGDVTRVHHHVTLRINEHMPLPHGKGVAQAEAFGLRLDEFLDTLSQNPAITEITPFETSREGVEFSVNIGRGGGGFLRPLMDAGVTPRTPFEVRDGWVEWDFATDQEHAKKLVNALKESDIIHRIISFSKKNTPRLLTLRQREVFDACVLHGYYETPRRITLTELAGVIGVSKSTLCEMIHLIEKHIVSEFADSVRHSSPHE